LRERQLVPCQIGAFFFNPLSSDIAARRLAAAKIARLIPLAAEVNCPWIAFAGGSLHPDIFGGADPANLHEAALAAAVHELTPLAALAAQYGVRLTLEPHLRSILATPERAAELCARVGSPALRVTFDVTNYYDFFALLDSDDIARRCGIALATHTGMIHLKEIALTGGFHLHASLVPIGQGRTDWAQVLSTAGSIAPADSWVLIEHCTNLAEARQSVACIRAAARSTDLDLIL